jgi:3,4-dihydroxy 2-butanone 4-phosphate synthase/GTP cyclohydrolase II
VAGGEATRPFSSIEHAIEDIRSGRMVVVCDDENRENEGDLTLAAQFATPEAINFMATHGRGLICLALTAERCDQLGLDLMAAKNESAFRTNFTVSIEAASGVTTGISAHDRAHTIQVAIDPNTKPDGLVQPGHVFPLKAKDGGVLERAGQTEAAVDLTRLAGVIPAGVICEIMNEDGTMARVPDLVAYCERHGLRMITVADLIAYRRRTEKLVERVVATRLPTAFGEFTAVGYRSLIDDKHHLAMVKGDVRGRQDVLVRVHSECLTGDVFHSLRCDCGEQLDAALAMIEREGAGVLLYLSQEGRGIGLLNKLRAYRLQEDGWDTVDANLKLGLPADLRDYGIGAQILVDLGLTSIRILTNNPRKIHGLEGYGLSVTDQVPIQAVPNRHNEEYLRTKRERLGHTLHHQGLPLDEEMIHEENRNEVEREALGATESDPEDG